ncbi:MAG TPA: GAF domain-containing protein [Solirubrobacteraceae bacterium]|nr:GAF domain-containing protein [Solirubrobacteraceae bacterium]
MPDSLLGSTLDPERLQRLLAVGRGLVSELDVDAVLDQVLSVARELTGARYAAVGVLDTQRKELERFITSGLTDEQHRAIGALPRGRGVLGVLIDDPQALRLHNVGQHPKSYGFPPGHPPMTSFLGVPIRVRGEVYGNLYLTEKAEGDFSDVDEEAISVLADWAAIAIDNARAYAGERDRRAELERAVGGLEATIDINRALGGETDLDRVLELIAKRARALVDAKLVVILLADGDRQTLTVSAMAGEGDPALIGSAVPIDDSLSGAVLASQQPARMTEVGKRLRHSLAELISADSGLIMPLSYRGAAVGVLGAFDRADGDFTDDDERLLASFASSAAIAVATAQRVAAQGLRRSIEASERERTRWARELHDETLQELAGLKVLLSSAREGDVALAIRSAIEQIEVSITGLRHLITELRPAALDDYGLGAAIEALVQRVRGSSGLDVTADIALAYEGGLADARHEPEIESTLYRLVQECLTNAARHADADSVVVTIEEGEQAIRVVVSDNGSGFDVGTAREGFGLVGMRERVELVGGVLEISSTPGSGTTISADVPARPRRAELERPAAGDGAEQREAG